MEVVSDRCDKVKNEAMFRRRAAPSSPQSAEDEAFVRLAWRAAGEETSGMGEGGGPPAPSSTDSKFFMALALFSVNGFERQRQRKQREEVFSLFCWLLGFAVHLALLLICFSRLLRSGVPEEAYYHRAHVHAFLAFTLHVPMSLAS